jgi:membrane-bound lytic murein transglycosylase D
MRTKLESIRVLLLTAVLAFPATLAGCASAGHGAPRGEPVPQQTSATSTGTEAGAESPEVDGQQVARQDDSSASGESPDAILPGMLYQEPPTDRAAHVHARMDEAYESGLEAYQAGRFDEAKEHFDTAVDAVLTSGLDLSEEPDLSAAFDEVVRNVADLDADLYTRNVAGRVSDSPLDALQDITRYLSPKEAERERQRIEEFAAEVTYDLPMVLHPKVLSFVEIFQTRLRKEFEAGLKRSGMYLPLIKKVFREEGIPEDLAYMAHQESAFKNTAYSRARAKGMWQFMSFTGRKYGLRRDIWVDERSDFEKATRAAAAYLKYNYSLFGDWYLAMAAYNAGEGKIGRAIKRSGSRDFWTIAKTRHIRRETKNYIPAILASILIDKSPEDYGFDVKIEPVLEWDTLDLDKPTDLQVIADATGATVKEIRFLNPELRGLMTPPNVSTYSSTPSPTRIACDGPATFCSRGRAFRSYPGSTTCRCAPSWMPIPRLPDVSAGSAPGRSSIFLSRGGCRECSRPAGRIAPATRRASGSCIASAGATPCTASHPSTVPMSPT